MKNQGLYRGGENKKAKPTKAEKVFNVVLAMQRKALAVAATKKATATV